MLIRLQPQGAPFPSEITPRAVHARRSALARIGLASLGGGLPLASFAQSAEAQRADAQKAGQNAAQKAGAQPLQARSSTLSTIEKPTAYRDVTGYNNFYEFGTEKSDPARRAQGLRVRPWTVSVEGEVRRARIFDIDEFLALAPLEERVYRMRCVEGWSMVIPWIGYPLSELIRRVEPTGNAKFVEFTTLADPAQMPGLASGVLDWPYVEGLRLDEAAHPLTLLTLGLYGEVLPRQNGAPVRIVVPWKYGFKSAKSIVRIRFVERQPATSWGRSAPSEYGFYSNVNPDVDHPRWSQATERRIGEDGFLQRKRKTLPFNGYAEQVASLYAGMDLRRHF